MRKKKEIKEKKKMQGTKSPTSSQDKSATKEKVCEIFKIEKDTENSVGKEKTIKACGIEETKVEKKGQVKSENKILKNVLIWLGILLFIFFLVFFSIKSANSFDYKGIQGDVIKEGNVIFYHTSFPMFYEGKEVNYNVYLRTNPRKLEKVPFDGELNLLKMMVIQNTENFVCDGKGGIAMVNFQQILGNIGMNFMKDPNAGCDPEGRYMFVKIQEGDVTGIEQTGPACYNLNVHDCEILEVTEKFLIESLVKLV